MSTRATARARAAAPAPARPRTRPPPAPPREAPAPRPRRQAGTRPRTRSAARVRLRMGRLVIPLIALFLGGIVFVNVAKLSLTDQTGKVIERARSVESETARLKATLELKDASVRRSAQTRLGMVEPAPGAADYLDPITTP